MLIVLSPAKTLDYTTPLGVERATRPAMVDDAAELIETLRGYSPADLSRLMGISDPLAQLNAARFEAWRPRFTKHNSRQAILAFAGDVYTGLVASELSEQALEWAQDHVRILSGLYGVLRPLDLMQAYRLEMGSRLKTARETTSTSSGASVSRPRSCARCRATAPECWSIWPPKSTSAQSTARASRRA